MKNPTLKILFTIAAIVIVACSSDAPKKTRLNNDYKGLITKIPTEQYLNPANAKKTARDFYIRGTSLQQENRFPEAIIEFQQALRYDSSAMIYYSLAQSFREIGKNDLALENVRHSLTMDSLFLPSMELLADVYVAQMRIDNAIVVYKQIISISPDIESKIKLIVLCERKDPDLAISLLEEISTKFESAELLMKLAQLYEKKKDTDKYLSTLDRLYSAVPAGPPSALLLIEKYLNMKNCEKAFDFISNIDKNYSVEDLSRIYVESAEYIFRDSTFEICKPLILKHLDRFDNRFLLYPEVNYAAGYIAEKLGDTVRRETFFAQSLKQSDTIADIPIRLALFYMYKKDYSRVLGILQPASARFPNDYRFPLYVGVAFSLLERHDSSIAYCKKSYSLNSNNLDVLSQLGMSYERMGTFDSSDFYYAKALAIDPNNPLINNNLAYSYAERGVNLDRALEMAELALSGDPDNPSYYDTYGWIQYKREKYDSALEYVLKSMDKGGVSAEICEHLGFIYHKLGKSDDAEKYWRKAIELDRKLKDKLEKLILSK